MRRIARLAGLCAIAALFCTLLIRSTYYTGDVSHPAPVVPTSILLASTVNSTDALVASPVEALIPEADLPELFALADQLWERQFSTIEDVASARPGLVTRAVPPAPVVAQKAPGNTKALKTKYREVMAIVTAYCPCERCCGRSSPGKTSRGKSAWTPGLAADPNAIPYGTRVFIPNYGLYAVDDTGGAMRRSWRRGGKIHIDIRMTYHWEAKKWGRRLLKVRIYEN